MSDPIECLRLPAENVVFAMQTITNCCYTLALAASLLVWQSPASSEEVVTRQPIDGTIDWVYSYQEGQQRARQTGKPLFVVFRCER